MIKKWELRFIILSIILIIFIIIGSFYDYQIAINTYWGQQAAENLFGIIFSYIGIIPTFVGWSFLGSSIIYLLKKENIKINSKKWLIALSVLLLLLAFLYFCNTIMLVNEKAFPVSWFIAYPIGLVVILGSIYLGYTLAKKSDNDNLLKTILFFTAVSLLMMLLTMVTKEIMARPRFRFVYEMNNIDYFKNWWQSGHTIKNSLNTSALSDEFSSFPSGHSSYSMFAIFIFPLIAEYNKKLIKYKNLLFIFGVLWWALTAFSRMTVGAHYLTDVSFGGLITIASYFIVLSIWSLFDKKENSHDCKN